MDDSVCSAKIQLNRFVVANDRPYWKPQLNSLLARHQASDDPTETEKKDKAKISIPAQMFLDPVFQPCKQMGAILAESGGWNFSSRESAMKAYAAAFKTTAPHISQLLKHDDLFWLAKLRNNLIHDGGMANAAFCNQVRQCPYFTKKKPEPDLPTPLDGPLICNMVDVAGKHGLKLIEAVSAWLTENSA